MKEALGIAGIVILLIVLIGVGPILTIMSVNALFGLNIAINFWTWLACAWLCLLVNGKTINRNKN